MSGFRLVVAAAAVAAVVPPALVADGAAALPLPDRGDPSFTFSTTQLVDPNTHDARQDPRLASDGKGLVVATLQHITKASNNDIPVSFESWTSRDRGRTWPDTATPYSPATCSPGTLLGWSNVVAPRADTIYSMQNCATVNTVVVSHDRGRTWQPTPTPVTGVADDEGQISADPHNPSTIYTVTHVLPSLVHSLVVSRSTDGGATWSHSVVNATEGPSTLEGDTENFFTPVQIDPRNSKHLFVFWIAGSAASRLCTAYEGTDVMGTWHYFTRVFMASSTDGGTTWAERQIADVEPNPASCATPPASFDPTAPTSTRDPSRYDLANLFPDAAIDAGGNVYVAYSQVQPGASGKQQSHVFLMRSTDGGGSFTTTQVDSGDIPTNYSPSIVAADAGRVDIAWEASSAPDETDPSATWAVILAQTINATRPHPTFTQTRVSGLIYTGGVCPACSDDGGAFAHSVEHQNVGLASDECGLAHVMWLADAKPGDPSFASEHVVVATQDGGPGIRAARQGRCAPMRSRRR